MVKKLKQAEAIAIHHPVRAVRARVLIEMDASDFAALLADGSVDSTSEVGQHTLDQITRALAVEGST